MPKKGDRYIIEIEEVCPAMLNDGSDALYRIKGFRSLVFDKYGLNMLKKLEPALAEVYRNGYEAAFDDGVKAGNLAAIGEAYAQGLKDGYEKGESETWDWCGEYIPCKEDGGAIPVADIRRVFEVDFFGEIFKSYSHKEAKQLVDDYLSKEIVTPAVGDEVRYKGNPPSKPFVVTRVTVESTGCFVDGIYDNGSILEDGKYALMEKTGRHFPIADLLKQMEGGNE